MAMLDTLTEYPLSELIIIPIIDASQEMSGKNNEILNSVMTDFFSQLPDIYDELYDTKLLLAPLVISDDVSWFLSKDNQPMEVDVFRWIDVKASGSSNLGVAFKLLSEKLMTEEKGGWIKARGGLAPILILITKGNSTDDYKKQLDLLKTNWLFRRALKFAVKVEDANKRLLEEFTGNSEAIIDVETIKCDLASIIKPVFLKTSGFIDDEPLVKENPLTDNVIGFKCDWNEYTIVTKVLVDSQYSRVWESPYYLVKDIMGNLNVIQIEDTTIKIYDYSRELLKELASKLLDNQIQLKEAFFRGHNKQIYVVYEECDTVKCMIIVREDSSMLDKMDSMKSTVFDW